MSDSPALWAMRCLRNLGHYGLRLSHFSSMPLDAAQYLRCLAENPHLAEVDPADDFTVSADDKVLFWLLNELAGEHETPYSVIVRAVDTDNESFITRVFQKFYESFEHDEEKESKKFTVGGWPYKSRSANVVFPRIEVSARASTRVHLNLLIKTGVNPEYVKKFLEIARVSSEEVFYSSSWNMGTGFAPSHAMIKFCLFDILKWFMSTANTFEDYDLCNRFTAHEIPELRKIGSPEAIELADWMADCIGKRRQASALAT